MYVGYFLCYFEASLKVDYFSILSIVYNWNPSPSEHFDNQEMGHIDEYPKVCGIEYVHSDKKLDSVNLKWLSFNKVQKVQKVHYRFK